MKLTLTSLRILAAFSGVVGAPGTSFAAPRDWTGASGAGVFWSTPENWSPIGLPGMTDDVRFFDPGAVLDTTINSTVSANTTIRSLWFGQTNGFHNLLIEPGVTLTVQGTNDNGFGRLGTVPGADMPDPNVQSTLYVGTKVDGEVATKVTATISGEGGILMLNNTNNEINIRQAVGGTLGGGDHRAILNMSGLGTFTANLSRIRVGDGEANPIRRAEGQLWLAKTNIITLSGPSLADDVQLVIGNNDVNNNGNGSISYLYLGQENRLNVDHVLVGARKQQGNISFQAGLISPSLIMRGSDGVSRVVALRIGDESDQANSGNPTTGRIDLNSGTVDILADTILVGKGQQQTGREAIGFLTLGEGNLDVNTLEIAFQTSETANNRVDGTVTFNGTTVLVNDLLRLGRSAGSPAARNATLNINEGGTVTVADKLLTEGTATINITNGLLRLLSNSPVLASTAVLDGGTISNAALIKITNLFVLTNNGAIIGNPVFDMGDSGLATWDVRGAPGDTLTVSNAFHGSGTYIGNLVQARGATISPGGNGSAGTLSIQQMTTGGDLTLEGGTLRFDLSNSGVGGNDQIAVGAFLNLNGTNDVNITALGGTLDISNPYTLISSAGLIGNETYFRVAGPLAESRYDFTFDTSFVPNSVALLVSSGPANLTWVGDGTANAWDLKGAANWTLGGPTAAQFFTLDSVTFNDFGSASPAVNLVGALSPSAITVSNPTKDYSFSGAGGVHGAPLTKDGAGSLTFNNTGDNSFGGVVTIIDGAVTFSNVGLNTFANGLEVNGGSLTLSGNNTNNVTGGALSVGAGAMLTVANAHPNDLGSGLTDLDGTLTIDQAVDSTMMNVLSGGGTLVKAGTGTLTLASDNSALSSVIQINGGTVRAGGPSAVGITGVAIATGGALNVNGQNLGTVPVTVAGAGPDNRGAIINTAAPQLNALTTVALMGNASFGGSGPWNTDPVSNRGRWDIRNGTLASGAQPFTLTKVGSNQVTLAGTLVDAALGDIDVQEGMLQFEGATTSMGDPTATLTVRAGATVSFFDTTTAWDKKIVLFGNGATPSLFNWMGANTIAGPVTLNGNCVIGGAPADRGTPVSLTLNGSVEGAGGLTKIALDTLVLGGTYTYTGDTVVNAGTLALVQEGSLASPNITIHTDATLDASGTFSGALTLAAGQTLKGNGAITGTLIAAAGSTVSPGASVGALSASEDVTVQGTTVMELDAALDTNDVLRAGVFMTFGGTLQLAVVSGTLAAGDSFKLFDAPSYSGSFTSIVPATPGPGLAWNTTTLASDGTLRIAMGGQPQIGPPALAGGNLVFSGTGGTPNGTYYVLSATNIALPLGTWTRIATNTFDGNGDFSVSTPINLGTPQRFFVLETP
ncbi:MAG: autotransporter-associated beta strand repeat-containing protein [Verrucomicrobia subdivision 3 bacterium]|nr:autotransporter-associated beta strand repeat-containing protein [Limisphaerales bacterium]